MTASDPQQPRPLWRNLADEDADRPAGELLRSLPWEGEVPDPDEWRAEDFLALL